MKDVLITGGAGKIGYDLVQKLADSNFSITVLDLESRESKKKLKKYADKIKIIYGDVEDADLVKDLVKKNDIVIDYAGIMPPLADLNEDIANSTNFHGCKNIVDAIKELNPECVYIYMSFISIYGPSDNVVTRLSVNGNINNPDDLYSVSIIRSEDYIRSNLKKYCILRMPIVLTKHNYYVRHMKLDRTNDFITVNDLNKLVIDIMTKKNIYKKTFNISGFKANSSIFMKNMYKSTGHLNLLDRTLYYGEYDDFEKIKSVTDIKFTTSSEYFKQLKKNTNPIKRTIFKIINYIELILIKKTK